MTVSDDLMAAEVIHDPHAYYRELRAEDPIHWNDRWGGWVVTRYDDVVRILRDAQAFSADRMAFLYEGPEQGAAGSAGDRKRLADMLQLFDPLCDVHEAAGCGDVLVDGQRFVEHALALEIQCQIVQ